MRIASSLVLIVLSTFSFRASAETIPPLVVERGAGAERCPDAEAIAAKIEQIRGRTALDAPSAYRVSFARSDEGFTATIRDDRAAGRVRTLEHDGANCAALGRAVALTLALLLDADIGPKKEVEPPPPPPAPSAVAAPPSAPSVPSPSRHATLSLGAVGIAGVLRPVSPALAADAGASFGPLRVSAGALWAWPQTLSLGPGAVHERLLAGFARICVRAWAHGDFRLDACSGALAGAVTAEAEGYTQNEHKTRGFIAVPFEVAFAQWTAPVGWEASLAGLVPLVRSDYTIEGIGTAYRSLPVGALLSLRVTGLVPW